MININNQVLSSYGFTNADDFFYYAAYYAAQFHYTFISPGWHSGTLPYGGFQRIIAWANHKQPLALNSILNNNRHAWRFGYFAYSLKDELFNLQSAKSDQLAFPAYLFFEADVVIIFHNDAITIHHPPTIDPINLLSEIKKECNSIAPLQYTAINCQIDYDTYATQVNRIHELILDGEVYELNFCHTYQIQDLTGNGVFNFLNTAQSQSFPFNAFFQAGVYQILSFSPERFLKKIGLKLISQPIKGTAKRYSDGDKDLESRKRLDNSPKEIAENMMITDLVRNDLARICQVGSVTVEELFGIHSFPTVHQMITTIYGMLPTEIDIQLLLKATFPMGSMTGAPKLNVMRWIDNLENFNRGAYSGALGYITPANDFDWSVLIRSLFINTDKKMGQYSVGSAITIDANAADEWQECLLKAKMLYKILSQGI